MNKDFLLAFIPIFVAVDAVGVLPVFASLTEGLTARERLKVIMQSMVTAVLMALGFILLGREVFRILNITIPDFLIAGGLILFCIAIADIMNPIKKHRIPTSQLGAVPIGTPLIVGPAVLATCLILIREFGVAVTLLSVLINVFLAGIIFSLSNVLIKIIGDAGAKALSKVTSLLLAAIAVMMVRKGILQILVGS